MDTNLKDYHYSRNNKCLECSKLIRNTSTRCVSCVNTKKNKSNAGKPSWNKGIPMSDKTKKKLSIAKKGKGLGNKSRTGQTNSLGTILKMKEWHKNNPRKPTLGMKFSEETRIKMRNSSQKGSKNVNWKGGVTKINNAIRHSFEYKLWRDSVLKRDKWTCVWCFKKGGWSKEEKKNTVLNVDHIKPFAFYPELRFAIDNGRTLCLECHKTTETYKRKINIYA